MIKPKNVFIVLQNGRPMRLAPSKSDAKIWALFFAQRKPTVFTTHNNARAAVLRQKYRENIKRPGFPQGFSLGKLRILTIPVV